MPRKRINPKAFPYHMYKWEKNGAVYEKIKIKKWKTKVPDASRFAKRVMPKKIDSRPDCEQVEAMVAETCVAESVHAALGICGFGCVLIWRGVGGITVSVLYALGNVPFILIQRYNRPRHESLAEAIKKAHARNTTDGGSYESA